MKRKLFAGLMMLAVIVTLGCPAPARADGQRVVTIGADLSPDQRNMILRYFGISDDPDVQFLTITNKDEHEHLDSFVPREQIGTRTISCAYVSPTTKGGIRVKTANLSWVTSNMIATTLSTAGIVNCDVIAAAPFKVSGTGALTGVIMAYEEASGEELDEVKKALATLELITTGKLADRIGQAAATEIVNEIKMRIIREGITDQAQIARIVEELVNELESRELERQDAAAAQAEDEEDEDEEPELEEVPELPIDAEMAEDEENVESLGNPAELSDEELDMLMDLAEQIAEQGYNYDDMKDTLQRVEENVKAQVGITAEPAEDETKIEAVELELPEELNMPEEAEEPVPEEVEELAAEEPEAAGMAEPIDEEEDSILFYTDDTALGADAILDSTNKEDNLPIAEEIEEILPDETEEEDLTEFFIEQEDEEVLDAQEMNQPEEEPEVFFLPQEEEEVIPEVPEEEEEIPEAEGEILEIPENEEEIPEEAEEPEPVEEIGEPVEEQKAEEPEEFIPAEEIEEIEAVEEEVPVVETEPEILDAYAVIEANESVKGMVRIYVELEDAVPVSGTVKVRKAGGKTWSKADVSDPSLVTAAPMDGNAPEYVDFSYGTVITVVTDMEASPKKYFGAEKEIEADFEIEAQGETYRVNTVTAVGPSDTGVVLYPAGTGSLSSGMLNAEIWTSAKKGTAVIISEDIDISASDRTDISFKDEDRSFVIYFLSQGTAVYDITFVAKNGDVLGNSTLWITPDAVPGWSQDEIDRIQAMAEAGLADEEMAEEAGETEEIEEIGEIEEIEEAARD